MLFRSQGKHAEAELIEGEVLGVRRRVLGEEHPDTLNSEYNVALLISDLGQYAEAERMLQATLEARRRVLGTGHPDTLNTAQELEYMRSQCAEELEFRS